MYRRLWSYRVQLVIFGFILLFGFMNPMNTTFGVQGNDITNDGYYINQFDNATFEFLLNSTTITRGEDDLVLHFRFVYDNETLIPDAEIHYNITSASDVLIFENTIPVLITDYVNETVIWSTFNSLDAGLYSVNAVANSTTTDIYQEQRSFELTILDEGRIRMFFPDNPVFLLRNESNYVDFALYNIGGSTVTNFAFTNAEKSGTTGSVDIFIPSLELNLTDGETYEDSIRFDPDTYLYKKYSFSYSYSTIDEPDSQIIGSSDPLDIIVDPFLEIDSIDIPVNVTMEESFIISFNIDNNENNPLYIVPKIDCDVLGYDNENPDNSIIVSPGEHQFSIEVNPITDGVSSLRFWVEIEWETISGTKWYSILLPSVIRTIIVYALEIPDNGLNAYYAYGIIFAAMFIGIIYFSRDVIKRLATKGRITSERQFPEVIYPLETVILDGSNIAWEEKGLSDKPKISNIEAMINRLSRADFKKIVTVADAALRYQIDNQRRLDKLVKEGAMKMLPARVDGDKFILRLAEEENAMIVSNDMFKEFRETASWIDQRRIPYTILDGEVYLHPTSAITTKELMKEGEEEDSK